MLEKSDEAAPWPASDRDPRETGRDVDRWPCFRGPGSQGVAAGGSPPVAFGPQKNVVWKAEIPGEGNSSPVVWQDQVLLTTATDGSDSPPLAVLSLDRNTGRRRWQTTVGQGEGRTHTKNGYASASPATDGERVFAFFGRTGLFCLDMAGKVLWRADLGHIDHPWGTASSPVLFEDAVLQLCDQESNSYLAAFRKSDGQMLWRTERTRGAAWSTPVLIDPGQGQPPQLLVNGGGRSEQGAITAYDPRTGAELWSLPGTTNLVTPVPVWTGGLIVSLSGRNGPIFALRAPAKGQAIAAAMCWRLNRGGPYVPSAILYRNRLYVLADSGVVTCINPGDGGAIWKDRLKGTFTASLVAADGRLYAVSEHGVVHVFAAAERFELLASNSLAERCLATPAIAGDALYVRTARLLYCFGSGSGESLACGLPSPSGAR